MIAYKLVPNLGFHDLEHLQPEIYNKVLSFAFRPTTEERLLSPIYLNVQKDVTCPELSKPNMSFPTEEVLPDSASCLCRNNFCLEFMFK